MGGRAEFDSCLENLISGMRLMHSGPSEVTLTYSRFLMNMWALAL